MHAIAMTLARDTLSNLTRFVRGNLAHGIDHLVVVTDGPPDPDVHSWLTSHPQVTLVVADAEWWGQDYIETLNARQRVAANLVRVACSRMSEISWLFFLDGDEVALIDRRVLQGLPSETSAVRLSALECATNGSGTVNDRFKRLLTKPELRMLRRAGLVERANNAHYFHGHVVGKVGIRPHLDVRLGLHSVHDRGSHLPTFEHPGLRHLHFESPTFEEFVRKWTALATSGPPPGMRDRRAAILQEFLNLQEPHDATHAEQRLRRLYDEFIVDDVDALDALGLLEHVDVATPTWLGAGVPIEVRDALTKEIASCQQLPKTMFL